MIKRILVANRGEIARRIIKTASEMSILTVAIYTADEDNAVWAKEANDRVLLSEYDVIETYLSPIRMLSVAKKYECDAIHPGYGFLSENYEFALACEKENIKFIGPLSSVIKLMGNKTDAREFVKNIGVSVPHGFSGSVTEILKNSSKLKFPLLIKAAGGGGGKGMHLAYSEKELPQLLRKASKEAKKWFNNDKVIVEQYFENARHIEVQILSDNYGNHIHLFERECSIQRNYQKIIEEAPSPTLSKKQRKEITDAALRIAQSANYTSAGTIEFLWQNGEFYFLEMNTRIQVEHTVSEVTTGIDIVQQQINVANNFELNLRQKDINITGHAIQARVYAEIPEKNFKPSVGEIMHYNVPKANGIRIDSSYNSPSTVSPLYDGLIAKIISLDENRNQAISRLNSYLSTVEINGIDTNLAYIKTILVNNYFKDNCIDTSFIKHNHQSLLHQLIDQKKDEIPEVVLAYIYNTFTKSNSTPNNYNSPFSVRFLYLFIDDAPKQVLVKHKLNYIEFIIDHIKYNASCATLSKNQYEIEINQQKKQVYVYDSNKYQLIYINGFSFKVSSQHLLNEVKIQHKKTSNNQNKIDQFVSPLHGTITEILAQQGQEIKQGDQLLTIESMKTENKIISHGNGIVDMILIKPNDRVKENEVLIRFRAN